MLVFFIWKYLSVSVGALELTLAILSILVFLTLYLACFWTEDLASVSVVIAILLIGVIWAPFNPGSSVFVVFSAACCASIRTTRVAYSVLATIMISVALEVVLLKLSPDFAIPALIVSGPIGVASIMNSRLRLSQEKLMRSREETAYLATIAERERISRDLHDLLGHTLSLITIKAELAGKLIGRDIEATQREIADIEKTARNALSEVRAAVTGYREVGFTHELANAASCLSAADIGLQTDIEEIKLSAAAENILSLALREAVTNVARHSEAGLCEIKLGFEGGWIVLKISDNGPKLSNIDQVKLGNGLSGMNERAATLGGKLSWEVNQGLTLKISLPKNHNTLQGA
jgi:two-component system sensor histidine kinase DesK